jgi:hypothetical protein
MEKTLDELKDIHSLGRWDLISDVARDLEDAIKRADAGTQAVTT